MHKKRFNKDDYLCTKLKFLKKEEKKNRNHETFIRKKYTCMSFVQWLTDEQAKLVIYWLPIGKENLHQK